MTAEIAILNKSAVALAADSKVTVSSGFQSKGYDTANKVFTLSKVHPVGIMIFGNAEFMKFPWETIIKIYREKKKDAAESTISDWSNDFISFLRSFGNINDQNKKDNIISILSAWFSDIEKICLQVAQNKGIAAPSLEYADLIKNYLIRRTKYFANAEYIISKDELSEIIAKHQDAILAAVQNFFRGTEDQELYDAAIEFSVAALCCDIFSPVCSGFVIAGFGEDEYFPTLVQYDTDGYVGDRIKLQMRDESNLSREMSSSIHAFAQRDMVQRFMMGIDPSLFETIASALEAALLDSCFAVLEEHGKDEAKIEEVKQNIAHGISERMKSIIEKTNKYMNNNFSEPVINMVAFLPKDELAHLAESLVALTSLQRRISSDAETVGGPIDVALISKGDGFIWVKRKHYFKPELNQHFSRNYMRAISAAESKND